MSKDSHEVTESTVVRLCEWRAELYQFSREQRVLTERQKTVQQIN